MTQATLKALRGPERSPSSDFRDFCPLQRRHPAVIVEVEQHSGRPLDSTNSNSEETVMKAIVYGGPGRKSWTEVPDPAIRNPADAVVKVDTTTICGTDLHILTGDVPAVTEGRILGHEGVGTITEVRDQPQTGRPRYHLLYQVLRPLCQLQERPLFALHG